MYNRNSLKNKREMTKAIFQRFERQLLTSSSLLFVMITTRSSFLARIPIYFRLGYYFTARSKTIVCKKKIVYNIDWVDVTERTYIVARYKSQDVSLLFFFHLLSTSIFICSCSLFSLSKHKKKLRRERNQ